MTFVLTDHDIERNASSNRNDVLETQRVAGSGRAGVHEAAVNEAKSPQATATARAGGVFVIGDLALLEEGTWGKNM